MYPYLRMMKEIIKNRKAPPLAFDEVHVSLHRVWLSDIDQFIELNNGRTLMLYDLGRVPMGLRVGLSGAMRSNRWGMAVAGACVRYRRRLRPFEKFEMRTRGLGWDERFFYIDQQIWKQDGECANHAVFRTAVTDRNGIVPTAKVIAAIDSNAENKALPDWVQDWLEAEDNRPWPPQR